MKAPLQSSLNEVGYNAYIEYLALKRHFTSSYDYHKYNGKTNASFESFVSRGDAYSFQRLGKQKDYKELILSNIVKNHKIWVGDLLSENARNTYFEWKKIQTSFSYHLEENLSELDDDFKSNFKIENGNYPRIVDLYLQKRISLEVFTVLVKITNSQAYWNGKVSDQVIFPDIMRLVDKYHPFLHYSTKKVKKIVKEFFFSV